MVAEVDTNPSCSKQLQRKPQAAPAVAMCSSWGPHLSRAHRFWSLLCLIISQV